MSDQDNIPTPIADDTEDAWKNRTCGSEYVINKLRIVERELATVTKDFEQSMSISKYTTDILEQERDSLRAEVENLKIWIDHTGFFCAGTDCHSVSDRALELLKGWKRNCMTTQSEPSQVGGKELQESSEANSKLSVKELVAMDSKIHDELDAAQATIAELREKNSEWANSAWGMGQSLHNLKNENAALRAERDAITRISNDKHRRVEDLESQLATAIAERDGASRVLLKNTIELTDEIKNLREQRDSALASCAAKDVALREMEVASSVLRKELPTHWRAYPEYQDFADACNKVRAALSPTAGIDYVPKAAFKAVASACQRIVDHWNSDDDDRLKPCADDVTACEKALTTAAQFLTDSTGEEGK